MEIKRGENRFYLADDQGNEAGEITYYPSEDNTWTADHTFVSDEYRGHNYAGLLLKALVEHAREEGKKIIPVCPYVKKEFDRREEYKDIEY